MQILNHTLQILTGGLIILNTCFFSVWKAGTLNKKHSNMNKKLLLAALLASAGLSAQTTHHIDWFMGVSQTAASAVIDEGDTVTWTWTDSMTHTVTSNAGGTETFNSGNITGNGETYSHTFTQVGETTYKCNLHAAMQGTITVAEVAGVEDAITEAFQFYPNPVSDILTIHSKEIVDRIEIYDINGRQLMNSKSGNADNKIYMANFSAGTYIVKVITGDKAETITVVKN